MLGLLLSTSFGMAEFGYAFFCKNMLISAAREGARAAAIPGSTSTDVTTAVSGALASTRWTSAQYTVAVTNPSGTAIDPSSAAVGTPIQVTVSGIWGTLGKGCSPLQLISATKQISGTSVMRKEQ